MAALSATSDAARGRAAGEAMRACLLATRLAERCGVEDRARSHVYYTALLRYAGCTATSHEYAAALGGNDIAVRAHADLMDPTRPEELLQVLAGLGMGPGRARNLLASPEAQAFFVEAVRADCEVGAMVVRRAGLPEPVERAVLEGFERYDGHGAPEHKAGEDIAEASRFASVAYAGVMFASIGGTAAAVDAVERWSQRALDPRITAALLDDAEALLWDVEQGELWDAVVEAEPPPRRTLDDDGLDDLLRGFADVADLKSPWFSGHSTGVAELARDAAAQDGRDGHGDGTARLAYRAGLVHDLGRVAVPTGIWERPGALRTYEWELVRLHPYLSGRILAAAPALAPLVTPVSRHHERLDGSGYPAGVRGGELDAVCCTLAAADVAHALREPRPHRPAHTSEDAAAVLAGLPLERDTIRAVLVAGGTPAPALPPLPASLTERELQVVRLLAAGHTKRQIADALVISQSTVHTHTVHIYEKCEVSTRAGLTMFAMAHGLLGKID